MSESSPRAPEGVADKMRRGRFNKIMFRFTCFVLALCLVLWGISPWVKFGFNAVSDSVDGYVFVIVKGADPGRGELIAFWPPDNRFYKNIWFVKYVKGVAGDLVERRGAESREFYINGEFVGRAKKESANGSPLEASEGGLISEGSYFVWTSHERSFDSRYEDIGWISKDSLIGRAYRIF